MTIESDGIPSVVSVALLVRKAFPDLNDRAFAVAEATLSKENMPNLPLAFIALLGIRGMNQSNNVTTPLDIEETICVEFWSASKNYAKADGSASPFYAFQDYTPTMDMLFNALTGYFTPQGKRVRFVSMDTMADEYCLTVCFKFTIEWRWCPDPDASFHPLKVKFRLDPQDVPKEVGGSLYQPPSECEGQLPFPGPVWPVVPPPNPKN
jgi:hypothetical protein